MSLRDKYTDKEWDELESRIEKKASKKDGYKRVIIKSEDNGQEYVIPYELSKRFDELYLTEEWDLFDEEFGKYACGGDPFNEYEFYIKER